jgi:hypothetical protein
VFFIDSKLLYIFKIKIYNNIYLMTYSIDVINLCFHHLHSNKTKKTVAKILEISINTINYWVCKYYSNYINKELITNETK